MESNKSIPKDSAMEPKKPAPSDSASSPATLILSLSVLSIASTYWFFRVSTEVPDPYLVSRLVGKLNICVLMNYTG